ncbi:DNA-binding transcriptional regulator, LysR family [Methylobacillus rhizosphaerae]|uniref:DNA-binding transcriptional regulator, LysR family n=1 Tax=Methylobacillus rhizosphaerae TaxID=551994 RepID=A0A239AK81_9PROT|nr:LysR family transcriptional regulator [Methylobacillus rhizosphaerae]SNR96086.1 DNA-binding transcriptional regulator, LysR family [Methylobacillus rhizosphaerae]
METIEAIKRFVRVAELASFTRAADQLGLPKASISNAVQQLESQLGTQLLHRTTRKVQLTPDGQVFYERGKHLLGEVDELWTLFQGDDASVSGIVRVDMSYPLARNVVIPQLPDFLQRYPNMQIELSSTDRRVDLVAEGYDCVVRTGQLADSGLVVRHLGAMGQANFVSPGYIQRYGKPEALDQLSGHWLIHYHVSMAARFDAFEYWDGRHCHRVPMKHRIVVNNTDAYRAACLAGMGIMQAPLMGVHYLLDEGKLVEILGEFRAPPIPVSLLYPQRRNLSRRVRIFMDWLSDILKMHLS